MTPSQRRPRFSSFPVHPDMSSCACAVRLKGLNFVPGRFVWVTLCTVFVGPGLPKDFEVFGTGQGDKTEEVFRKHLRKEVNDAKG